LEVWVASVHQTNVGLINEGRRLKTLAVGLGRDVAVSYPPKLVVDQRRQLIQRGSIPLAPRMKQRGDTRRIRTFHI